MAPSHRKAVLLWSFTLSLLLSVLAQTPTHSISYFRNLPARLFFFDDQPTAVYHDLQEQNLYVSQNEGKSWDRASDIPEGAAAMVFEHPFDNKYAFVLTKGKTHYRTDDRGKTWRSFEVPAPPARVGRPLSFHSDPKKYGWIIYQGTICENSGPWGTTCHDETYYTKDGFGTTNKLLSETSNCLFAHSSKDFKHDAHEELIYCVAFDSSPTDGVHSLSSSRLFSSTDFFQQDKRVEELGIGKNARGVVALAIVSKYAVVAMRDLAPGNNGEMLLYVSIDTKTWAKAQFPHASSAQLRENAYTVVESTTHSLAVDVVLQDQGSIGTLFVSNSNGTYFVESLRDTNRNDFGYVDYENIYGIEGVGIANIVANAADVESRRAAKKLQSRITFDDGRTWSRIRPPAEDSEGRRTRCNPADNDCSLHLHSVTLPHNFGRVFSSPAPGFVMGVGSIGDHLKPYDECDTFLSTDNGVTWKMVRMDAHQYEFGDSGSVLVMVNDEDSTDTILYSTDLGKNWNKYKLDIKVRSKLLTTIQDSTSQKFLLVGQVSKHDAKGSDGRYVVVFLDFANTRSRKCGEVDFEKWYARTTTSEECLLGHKQWYKRRKPDANCYVGEKFTDPVVHEEPCPCTDEDFECDYNFIRQGDKCVPAGPEPIPAGVCGDPTKTYMGSSGWKKIPGDTCDSEKGKKKDAKVEKSCSKAQPPDGEVVHQTFEFVSPVVQYSYFKDSTTILVRLRDGSIWQSSNEGYTWEQLQPNERFVAFYHHAHSTDRAYLITESKKFWYTTDTGKTWNPLTGPTPPNSLGLQVLRFHPMKSDYLIWSGSQDCGGFGENCHVEAYYTLDNGRKWDLIDKYVRNCGWARDSQLFADPNQIICESYRNKQGSQKFFGLENPMELVSGSDFYRKKDRLFEQVVGYTVFSEFMIVAEYQAARQSLDLQVSLDGRKFATGLFPPTMRLEQHAYTILESSTQSVFLHVTTSEAPSPTWGNILKSNSNGTYYGVSIDYVNRNDNGYVDFEKMIGLDGIALINVVSNPSTAPISGRKELQSRITHNDGGTWKPLPPPRVDSQGNKYACESVKCSLHIHGYTERWDARATYSTPSVPGLLMAVGNVGESLAPYTDSDTFLSRDAGFTWEEVHKDAHLWEFGDSGSILIMANDEDATDHVMFSLDEGLNWREYRFSDEKIRVKAIVTVPADTSRRFMLLGYYPRRTSGSVVVHLDFSALTRRPCVLDIKDSAQDDFELWSPSEERTERCLFGRRTLYHRRKRDANCVVGEQKKQEDKIIEHCVCTDVDFECEFNYRRDLDGKCVLVNGTLPLPPDDTCRGEEDYWYDRTPYRKIPYSSCIGDYRPDHGEAHLCPGIKGHGFFFWLFVLVIPFAFTALVGYWYYRKSGLARGTIRLPGGDNRFRGESGVLDTLASVPWFLLGLAGIAWEWVSSHYDEMAMGFRSRRGYRNVPVDEDAQVLRFEDEE
ncbi:Oligoxyloglucan reducing end-specific cellobiohydrolase [Cristinia sonorae]|uniref:Vacuolar protein sorting/targeting protein 10 n=1 Tax=Cristinia sonorae TaxID=1940300 RepID=A0A8K0UIK4_9AGAR|nr:Oligoxyloglucan reducing end-specific cellobiohydrolase [Cristinia sonorae]